MRINEIAFIKGINGIFNYTDTKTKTKLQTYAVPAQEDFYANTQKTMEFSFREPIEFEQNIRLLFVPM